LRRTRAAPLPRRQWPAAGLVDLERALDALRVVRREARRGDRIDAFQARMQRRPAVRRGLGVEARARDRISAWKYSIVPPTSKGTRPRARTSTIAARASATNAAAE
jgi:hypothetical protein